MRTELAKILRFGVFEVDVRAGEVRKQRVRIKLQEQPFHVLTVLLQRPGEVVTREELRSENFCAAQVPRRGVLLGLERRLAGRRSDGRPYRDSWQLEQVSR